MSCSTLLLTLPDGNYWGTSGYHWSFENQTGNSYNVSLHDHLSAPAQHLVILDVAQLSTQAPKMIRSNAAMHKKNPSTPVSTKNKSASCVVNFPLIFVLLQFYFSISFQPGPYLCVLQNLHTSGSLLNFYLQLSFQTARLICWIVAMSVSPILVGKNCGLGHALAVCAMTVAPCARWDSAYCCGHEVGSE